MPGHDDGRAEGVRLPLLKQPVLKTSWVGPNSFFTLLKERVRDPTRKS